MRHSFPDPGSAEDAPQLPGPRVGRVEPVRGLREPHRRRAGVDRGEIEDHAVQPVLQGPDLPAELLHPHLIRSGGPRGVLETLRRGLETLPCALRVLAIRERARRRDVGLHGDDGDPELVDDLVLLVVVHDDRADPDRDEEERRREEARDPLQPQLWRLRADS